MIREENKYSDEIMENAEQAYKVYYENQLNEWNCLVDGWEHLDDRERDSWYAVVYYLRTQGIFS